MGKKYFQKNENSVPNPPRPTVRRGGSRFGWALLAGLALLGSLCLSAQANPALLSTPYFQDNGADSNPGADSNTGPVRLSRFSYVNGDVTWRGGTDGSWSQATQNLPLRQGAQIWVGDSSRAEVQFDDGSRVRLDNNTLITLQTLYSDAQGEFTEITVNEGEVYLRLKNKFSLYQVNTPQGSLKATGPGRFRVGTGEGAQFSVRSGQGTVESAAGKLTMNAGDYLDLADGNAPLNVTDLPRPDAWDDWNDGRDRQIDEAGRRPHYMPSNIALVADDLDAYGNWHNDPRYGWVWAPRVVDAGWRPYGYGHWTWVEPFGWTWVSSDAWGWAPYHYGTWTRASFGWAWVPGPAVQYWSPAVVSFHQGGGGVAWCSLAPAEVRYPPALSIGFRSGNWSAFFSIGSAAVYYPTANHICVAQPFANNVVNHVTYVHNVTNITNITNINNYNTYNRHITVNRNTYLAGNFVPTNARAGGGMQASQQAFAGRGAYVPVSRSAMTVFTQGRAIAAPIGRGSMVAGPQSVTVTRQAFTPTRSYLPAARVPQPLLTRAVYRAPLPARVPRAAVVPQSGQRFVTPSVARTPARRPGTPPFGSNPGNNSRTANGTGTRTGTSARTGTGAPNGQPGRSSALDQYLKERAAARNGGRGAADSNPGGADRTVPNNRPAPDGRPTPGNRPSPDNRPTPSNRPAPVNRPGGNDRITRPRSNDNGIPSTGTPQGRATYRRSAPPVDANGSYRPLHSHRSAPDARPARGGASHSGPAARPQSDNGRSRSGDHGSSDHPDGGSHPGRP